jgi:hypothetical protein
MKTIRILLAIALFTTLCAPILATANGGGCTYTPGYWKTHSEYGPSPYDPTWQSLTNGADTAFYLSGQSWYEVMYTPPAGNAYYILARQYVAAHLNVLSGADSSAIILALNQADGSMFSNCDPEDVATGAFGCNSFYFKGFAELIADFNDGFTGPGACSYD